MIENKLYVKTALKTLENPNNCLVWWFPWNGIVRNRDGEEIGTLSSNVINKLMETEKLELHSCGRGLLDHERYYVLKTNRRH
jgi:hypothetical protein